MSNRVVEMLCLWDLMLHSRYDEIASTCGSDFVFEKVSSVLKQPDILFGNLEAVMSQAGEAVPGKLCLRGTNDYLQALKKHNVGIVSLANNHTFDFGPDAYADMEAQLAILGIATVGAGKNLDDSRQLEVLEKDGIRFGFLAYSSRTTKGSAYADEVSPGVAPLDVDLVVEDIIRHKDEVDHLVVSLHWGVEYAEYPTPDQMQIGHRIIDAGARLIIGHHPHIIQGYEKYKDGVILYSLGNFCDSDLEWQGVDKVYRSNLKIADRESIMAQVRFSQTEILDLEFIPTWLTETGQPEIASAQKKEELQEKFLRRSEVIARPDFQAYWENMILEKRVGTPLKNWLSKGNFWDKVKNFRPSQLLTLWALIEMYFQARFSKSSKKYFLLNPGDDEKPRPYCGKEKK
jgi:hypothetical protein